MPFPSSPKKLKLDVNKLQVVKLSENATLLTKGTPLAAGYDLYSAEVRGSHVVTSFFLLFIIQESTVPARGKGLVKTDLQIRVPRGTYGRVAPRSGLAWKNHMDIGAGVVDEDYRGNVGEAIHSDAARTGYFYKLVLGVVMFNHADTEFVVKKGDRIAQLVCEKIAYPELEVLESLDHTERGEEGFGSTGTS